MVNFGLPSFIRPSTYPAETCLVLGAGVGAGGVSVGWKGTDTILVLMDTGDRQILLIIEIIGIVVNAVNGGL